MGSQLQNATFQAAELRKLGYQAHVMVAGSEPTIVVHMTIEQAVFVQAATAVANTRVARSAKHI